MTRYRFMGEDLSCGYRHGRTYWGKLYLASNGRVIFFPLNIYRIIVPYSCIGTFHQNWRQV